MSRRIVLIFVLVLAGAGLGLLFSSHGNDARTNLAHAEDDASSPEGAQLDGQQDAQAAADRPGRATPARARPWSVRCLVLGPPGRLDQAEPWAGVPVALTLIDAPDTSLPVLRATTGEDGRCVLGEIPASIWTPDLLTATRAHFLLRATLPGGRTQAQRLGSPRQVLAALGDAAALQPGAGAVLLDHQLDARRAVGIRVRTCTKDGIDLCGLHFDGVSRPALYSHDIARIDHTHWIDARPPPDHLVATLTGAFQLSERIAIPASVASGSNHDLVIGEETVVTGRLLDPGGKPLANVHVVLADDKVGPNRSRFVWREINRGGKRILRAIVVRPVGGRPPPLYTALQSTRTDADGRFAFAGLKRDTDYHLFWGDAQDHWHLEPRPIRRGDAPLEYRVVQSGFHVAAVDKTSGAALPDARIRIERTVFPAKGSYGPADLAPISPYRLARRGDEFRVSVACAGYEPRDVDVKVTGEAVQRIEIPMTPRKAPPQIRFVLVDDAGAPVKAVHVDVQQSPHGTDERGLAYDTIAALPRRDGNTITVGPLHPGEVRARFRPLGAPGSRGAHRFLRSQLWIGMAPAEGEQEVKVVMQRGGRLLARLKLPKVESADASGGATAEWVTIDVGPEGGMPERADWRARSPSGVWLGSTAHAIQVFDGAPVESTPIEPGTYTMTIGAKHPDHPRGVVTERIVVIKPGEVTEVEVDLGAAPPAPEPDPNAAGACGGGACG